MNKQSKLAMWASFLILAGAVLVLDVFGLIQQAIMVFLAFLGILVILYGLKLMGIFKLMPIGVVRFLTKITSFFPFGFMRSKRAEQNKRIIKRTKKSGKTEVKSSSAIKTRKKAVALTSKSPKLAQKTNVNQVGKKMRMKKSSKK